MKIIVLDGAALAGKDLTFDALAELGEVKVYDRTPPEQIVPRSQHAEALIINKVALNRSSLEQLPDLRYISVTATGVNVVDLPAARDNDVVVTNVPTYGTESVAQLTFALLLELCHRVAHHSQTVRDGRWSNCPDFCYWDFPLVELAGKTLGIVGFGRIGQAVARLGRAFGMEVLAHDRRAVDDVALDIEPVDLDDLLARSDVVSLHCPLNEQTQGLISADRLAKIKPSAYLINTSRGALIDETALADALNTGRLAGAGLDVLSTEPPEPDNPLLGAKNCFITPHIAWATRAARRRLLDTTVENLRAFLDGEPQNVVS